MTWGAATGSATGLGLAKGLAMVRAARTRVRVVVANFMVLNLMKLFGYVGYGGCSTDLKR